jgi:hypothetical protein
MRLRFLFLLLLASCAPGEGGISSLALVESDPSDTLEIIDVHPATSMVFADFDSDGWLDLYVGRLGDDTLYLNDGEGSLEESAIWTSPFEEEDTYAVAAGDWDNDGAIDIAIGGQDDPNGNKMRVLENNHSAEVFSTTSSSSTWQTGFASGVWDLEWGDLDNDGDLDLATAGINAAGRLYLNDRPNSSTLVDFTSIQSNSRAVAWADVTGDGLADLYVGIAGDDDVLLTSTGTGLSVPFTNWNPAVTINPVRAEWGSFDGFGSLDLAVVTENGESVTTYLGSTGAPFLDSEAHWTSNDPGDDRGVAWVDGDGDADLDLYVARYGDTDRGWGNTGNASTYLTNFIAWESDDSENSRSMAVGDIDNDGDMDLAVGLEDGTVQIFRNEGFGMAYNSSVAGPSASSAVDAGDFDADGNIDLVFAGYESDPSDAPGPVIVLRNQGPGNSPTVYWTQLPGQHAISKDVAWADFNDDGDLDFVVAEYLSPNRVYLQDSANSTFNLSPWTPTSEPTLGVAVGDINGDGHIDLVFANGANQANEIYLGDGFGDFTEGNYPMLDQAWLRATSQDVALADMDLDGDLDIAFANSATLTVSTNAVNRAFRNDPEGLVPDWEEDGSASAATMALAWGDWNGDGYPDLAVANTASPNGTVNRVYDNSHGTLLATSTWSTGSATVSQAVEWIDWDGDGDLDLAFGGQNPTPGLEVYRNESTATAPALQDVGDGPDWTSDEIDDHTDMVWADLDSDGDADLIVTNDDSPAALFYDNPRVNLGRPLADNPVRATVSVFDEGTGWVSGFGRPQLHMDSDIDLEVLFTDLESGPIAAAHMEVAEGGGDWQTITTSPALTQCDTSPAGESCLVNWDHGGSVASPDVRFRVVMDLEIPHRVSRSIRWGRWHSTPSAPVRIFPCFPYDADGDGEASCEGDCNDEDANTNSMATVELCDGEDNDCSGSVPADEQDADGDGQFSCDGDCDDTDANTYTGAPELCDNVDNACDGVVDADELDQDGDGVLPCQMDCAPLDADTYPGAPELCDGVDNDCYGQLGGDDATMLPGASNDTILAQTAAWRGIKFTALDTRPLTDWVIDLDATAGTTITFAIFRSSDPSSGFELFAQRTESLLAAATGEMSAGVGTVLLTAGDTYLVGAHWDLASDFARVFPSAGARTITFADYLGSVGESGTSLPTDPDPTPSTFNGDFWVRLESLADDEDDTDGDGYYACDGDNNGAIDDCNDDSSLQYEGFPEVCDGLDNDCDGSVPTDELDEDNDGVAECLGDCQDDEPAVYPGADEICDGLDNDCDGDFDDDDPDASPLFGWFIDSDGDGYGDINDAGIAACFNPGSAV